MPDSLVPCVFSPCVYPPSLTLLPALRPFSHSLSHSSLSPSLCRCLLLSSCASGRACSSACAEVAWPNVFSHHWCIGWLWRCHCVRAWHHGTGIPTQPALQADCGRDGPRHRREVQRRAGAFMPPSLSSCTPRQRCLSTRSLVFTRCPCRPVLLSHTRAHSRALAHWPLAYRASLTPDAALPGLSRCKRWI